MIMPFQLMAAEVTIHMKGFRNNNGHVILGIYPDAETFSNPRSATTYKTDIKITDNEAVAIFDLEAGDYAIALFHDENDDQELEMKAGAIPDEGWGFSRDALLTPVWPDFEDAVFQIDRTPTYLEINLQYSVLKNFGKALSLDKLSDMLPWPFN